MRISDWSSDVCSSDLTPSRNAGVTGQAAAAGTYSRPFCFTGQPMTYRIRAARPAEADSLRAIENAAGQAFVAVGYGDIAEQEDTAAPALRAAAIAGRLLVIVDATDHPAGFILCSDLDGDLHVQELDVHRSEEHTSELQSLMSISYAVFCLKKKNQK